MTFMSDINRRPKNEHDALMTHTHVCPECKRPYTCNCSAQPGHESLVCIDCEKKGV